MLVTAVVGLVAAVVGGFLIGYYALRMVQAHRTDGGTGLQQHSRLTCPKCHGSFDYDWVPGASFTAVRLGSRRYMPCPLCRSWSTFEMPRASSGASSSE